MALRTEQGKYGSTLVLSDDTVVAIELQGRTWTVGQRVTANGRMHVANGVAGTIVHIGKSFENGRTDDVLEVSFDGAPCPYHMKPKDLEYPVS